MASRRSGGQNGPVKARDTRWKPARTSREVRDERSRRKRMRENREEFRKFLESLPRMSDSTPLIREDKDSR